MSREEAWTRFKRAGEKWPRYTAEIPPELAEEIDRAQRLSLGVNQSAATRAGVVRAGLRLYLAANLPELPEPIDSTAVEITEPLAIATETLTDRRQ